MSLPGRVGMLGIYSYQSEQVNSNVNIHGLLVVGAGRCRQFGTHCTKLEGVKCSIINEEMIVVDGGVGDWKRSTRKAKI